MQLRRMGDLSVHKYYAKHAGPFQMVLFFGLQFGVITFYKIPRTHNIFPTLREPHRLTIYRALVEVVDEFRWSWKRCLHRCHVCICGCRLCDHDMLDKVISIVYVQAQHG